MKYKKTIKMGGLEFQHTRNGLMITKTIETTADEMFEKLGYEYSECYCEGNLEEIYYTKKGKYTPQIKISLYHKVIKVFRKEEKASSFDMKLLQAINKKCQELGWI